MNVSKVVLFAAICSLSACEYAVRGCDGVFCVNASSGTRLPPSCDVHGRCTSSCPDIQTVDESMLREITLARRVVESCPAESTVRFPNMTFDATLDSAARMHAFDMATNQFLSETGSDGLNVFDRVDAIASSGFSLDAQLAQLVASGFSHADEVVDFWLDNPASCATLLSDRYSHLGASCARGADEQTRWSVVLGGADR